MAKGTDPDVPRSLLPKPKKGEGMESGEVRTELGFPDGVIVRVVWRTAQESGQMLHKGEEGLTKTQGTLCDIHKHTQSRTTQQCSVNNRPRIQWWCREIITELKQFHLLVTS